MAGLMTIQLEHLRFIGYHGLYAEEKKTGNEFEVNLSVSFYLQTDSINDISETINYTALYELVKIEMQLSNELLETFALSISRKIKTSFPGVKIIEITISKLHPPIEKFIGNVGVNYKVEY